MLEKAKTMTRQGQRTSVEYARWADDLVILVDGHPQHDWLLTAVNKRLREELANLQVEINEEKNRTVDLTRGESFGYLGFDFRRVRSRFGKWRPLKTPKVKKRTELLGRLKEVFRSLRSQPVPRIIERINPILRGWVNYFGQRERQSMLVLRPRLGGKEGAATSCAKLKGVMATAAKGGVGGGCTRCSGYSPRIGSITYSHGRQRSQLQQSHNPWCEACREAECGKPARSV
jgi:hypothetical protein